MIPIRSTYCFIYNSFVGVATLPAEIRRNFALMRELDTRSQGNVRQLIIRTILTDGVELIDKIEKAIKIYNQNGKRVAKDMIDERSVKQIRSDIKTCLEYGDEKVALAVQTYELVCYYIFYIRLNI